MFTHIGTPSFFANWASLSVFTGGIVANPSNADLRQNYYDIGTQLDIRLVALSLHQFTVSFGYASAFQGGTKISNEFMVSLKIPFYD